MRYQRIFAVLLSMSISATATNASIIWTGGTFFGNAQASAPPNNDSQSFNSGANIRNYTSSKSANATGTGGSNATASTNATGSLLGDTFSLSGGVSASAGGGATVNSGAIASLSSYAFQLTDSRKIALTGSLAARFALFGAGMATLKFSDGPTLYSVSGANGQTVAISYTDVLAPGSYEFSLSQSISAYAPNPSVTDNFSLTLALTAVPEPSLTAILPVATLLVHRRRF